MPKDFLSYWKPETAAHNLECGSIMNHAASEQYRRVNVGDTVWIVTVNSGDIFLVGRIIVDEVADQNTASRRRGTNSLWNASFHILSNSETSLPMTKVLITHLAVYLRFESRSGNTQLSITDEGVNAQQLQTMRVLTYSSAQLLNDALATVDSEGDQSSGEEYIGVESTQDASAETDAKGVSDALAQLQEACLASEDLLKRTYRNIDRSENPLDGFCYVICESMFHMFPRLFTPYRISWGDGTTHYFLRYASGEVLEATVLGGGECCDASEYAGARKIAFFTKTPSQRARQLMARAGLEPLLS